MCPLFAVDIVGFTRPDRDDDIRLHLHEVLYRILEQGFDAAGIPWSACWVEDRGDGALVVIPAAIGAKAVIDPLLDRLRGLVRRHNHVARVEANIQLRVAVHLGPVDHDGHGFVGDDVNFLFRLLNARPLRAELTRTGAELACITSAYVYRTIICRHPTIIRPDDFQAIRFRVKHTGAQAWIHLPGRHSLANTAVRSRGGHEAGQVTSLMMSISSSRS